MAPGRERTSKARSGTREKHGWLRLDRYRHIHQSGLKRNSFVLADNTDFTDARSDGVVELTGTIECVSNIVIQVDKYMSVRRRRGRLEVRTFSYRYHALIRGTGVSIIRYDNSHGEDDFDRHIYDLETGVQTLTKLERGQFPVLTEIIDEVEQIATNAGLLKS